MEYAREAARLARLATDVAGDTRSIEIAITELGFVVRGTALTAAGRVWSSIDVGFEEPNGDVALINAVRLVNDRLPNSVELL